MTNPCSPLSSEPRDSTVSTLVFDAAAVASFLLNQGMGWLSPFAPKLGPISVDADTFCADAPYDLTTSDPAEIAGFFSPLNPTGASDLRAWMRSVFYRALWFATCQCSDSSFPTPPAPVPQPPGVNISPPSLTDVSTGTCCTIHTQYLHTNTFTSLANHLSCNPGTDYSVFNNAPNSDISGSLCSTPRTPTLMTYTLHNEVISSPGHQVFFAIGQGTVSTNPTSYPYTLTAVPGATVHTTVPFDPSFPFVSTQLTRQTGSGDSLLHFTLDLYCNGGGPGVQTPCCPPDPSLQGQLDEILQLVTLLQRQLVPFATIPGATHSGLTGSGSFSLPRLIGVKVHVDVPGYVGEVEGNPDYYPDLGWISVSTPDGFINDRRISQLDFMWSPPLMSDVSLFGYYCNPGVTISVQELEAEP